MPERTSIYKLKQEYRQVLTLATRLLESEQAAFPRVRRYCPCERVRTRKRRLSSLSRSDSSVISGISTLTDHYWYRQHFCSELRESTVYPNKSERKTEERRERERKMQTFRQAREGVRMQENATRRGRVAPRAHHTPAGDR